MKATGITRKVDELGRIVLPIELKDTVEIYTEGDKIILKKYAPACMFCGEAADVIPYKGKNICPECAKAIGKMAKGL